VSDQTGDPGATQAVATIAGTPAAALSAPPPPGPSLIDWLQSEAGGRLVESLASKYFAAHANDQKRLNGDQIFRYATVVGAIVIAGVLQYFGRLDTVMVSLLSTTVGFLFGRETKKD